MPINAKTQPIYSNHVLQAPDGMPISRIAASRSAWYLKRELATVVCEEPFTIRLKFEPQGRGHAGDTYYLADKENRCVVCGQEDEINKHHVVPKIFRRHMPAIYKNRTSHDVLVLCVECHTKYETIADRRKAEIAKSLGYEYSISQLKDMPEEIQREHRACKSAVALLGNRATIPADRIAVLEANVREQVGDIPLTEEVLKSIGKIRHYCPGYLGSRMAKYILERVDIGEFCLGWRRHFVETMCPKHLPAGWSVDNPLFSTK